MIFSEDRDSITKSQLVERMAEKLKDHSVDEVKLAVDTMLDQMSAAIASGRRIEIRGFGSFDLTKYKARKARNPRSGEPVYVGATSVPHFKPGSILSEKIDY